MPMKLKAQLMDDVTVKRALARLSYEIIEKSRDLENVVLIGIKTRGVPIAEQIAANIETHTGVKVQTCTLDITFCRDDLTKRHDLPTVNTQTLPVDLNDKEVILVDDVLFTGRTVRAAIDAVFRFGRPARIRLVVLVDRGHRELPIRPDFVGKNIPTSLREIIAVHLEAVDGKTNVEIYEQDENEPEIYNAIKFGSLVENVIMDDETREFDFDDGSLTENTRVGYPVDYISNAQIPGVGGIPKVVIFLTADAFGVLPPVSILTEDQTQYYFLSGFTAKLAGTERGITEPTPTFSACFGQAFLELHPTKYAAELVKKMEKSGAKAYLVNTGWNGTGKRISIKDTRGIIDAILSGAILTAPTKQIPFFNFEVPTELPGVDSGILDPRDTYADASEWETKALDLADRFIKNFAKYEGNAAGKALVAAGPQL